MRACIVRPSIAALVLACAFASAGARAAQRSAALAPRTEPLEVIVLGSGGPRTFGRGAASYVVLIDGVPRVLVDSGAGAFVEVGRLGLALERMDVVLLTHLHIDHASDLPAVFNARALMARDAIEWR